MGSQGWVITYLSSAYMWSTIASGIVAERNAYKMESEKIRLENFGDAIGSLIIGLIWPISTVIGMFYIIRGNIEHNLREKAKDAYAELGFKDHTGKNDRSFIVDMDENLLKVMLKAHRKKVLTLTTNQVEVIRDELSTRNMERDLLK